IKSIKIDINNQNVFFTSDTHFHHKNIIEYCNRPFSSLKSMDETMMARWNNVVGPDDVIFHAGDFCFGNQESWKYLLNNLNGKKYLAIGNHDKSVTPEEFVDVKQIFNIIIMGDEEVPPGGQRITVCHYPMISWYQSHRGSWQLFGHVHGMLSGKGILSPNQLDVGVDANHFSPISYDQVKAKITKQNIVK
ncbi:MAG: metallophosphatase, partial [Bacteroidales bacterium]